MSPFDVGLLIGTIWAATLAVWALADQVGDEPHPWLLLIQEIYIGFGPSIGGIIIGSLWAFCDGFVTGYVLSTLWNWVRG